MCPGNKNDWFAQWFDSPYYHALYCNRDENEAAIFLSKLLERLQLQDDAKLLDLACGKGRHSIYLNSRGFDVTGVDLSKESIGAANKFANEKLHFEVADMRAFQLGQSFQVIFNLFTSFGYFDNEKDNLEVLLRVKEHLVEDGKFVLDYFNANMFCAGQHSEMEKEACGFQFKMKKRIEDGRIYKDIEVRDGEKKINYREQVQLLNATMLHALLEKTGFTIVDEYGNYNLDPFHPETSERLIIIAQRR